MSLTFDVSESPAEILLMLSEYRVIMSFASLTSLFFSFCLVKKSPRKRNTTNAIIAIDESFVEFGEKSLIEWMDQWRQGNNDDQIIRGTLGRLLFSGDEVKKSVQVLSGGEQGRMLFGKLILQKPNILFMDKPTNHLDMESIESLNSALERYTGTLIFVSHDREFVSSLATRILEINPNGINDFKGNYEDYLRSQSIQ